MTQKLEQILLDEKVVTKDALDLVERIQSHILATTGERPSIVDVLRNYRFTDLHALDLALEKATGQAQIERVELPLEVCQRLRLMVVGGMDSGVLQVASTRPLREADKESLVSTVKGLGYKNCIGVKEVRVPGGHTAILKHLSSQTVNAAQVNFNISKLNKTGPTTVSMPDLLIEIIHDAKEKGASDVHIMHRRGREAWGNISYRVAGKRKVYHLLNEEAGAALSGQLKIASGLDSAVHHKPQDGRMSVPYQGRDLDIRVNIVPTVMGAKAVLRILDTSSLPSRHKLFHIHPEVNRRMEAITRMPAKKAGFSLVTGYTGSGKTTTLNALVAEMNREALNVITIEDPVEMHIEMATQIQVNKAADMDFAAASKSTLRADPDVLLFGEIRDVETLRTAVMLADTGHYVLSTLHTRTVFGSFARIAMLVDKDDRDALMLSVIETLHMLMNQRLVQTLCTCRQPIAACDHPDPGVRAFVAERDLGDMVVGMRKGCPDCGHTGVTNGRVQVPEALFLPDNEAVHRKLFQLYKEGSVHDIVKEPGVFYYSRDDAIKNLLENMVIDLETAMDVLGTLTA